ncbi:MAG: hypothetical protein HY996_03855 [Micrococcales bacterium]|nr:hypothetical protein [Micrococcales bacterium]
MTNQRFRRPWVLKWIRQETFWRDVTTQALGGSVVVVIAFIASGAAGLVDERIAARVGLLIFTLTAMSAAMIAVSAWLGTHVAEPLLKIQVLWKRRMFFAIYVVLFLTAMLGWFFLFDAARRLLSPA